MKVVEIEVTEQEKFKVRKGDVVEIHAQGISVIGQVYSADYWKEGGWYIEVVNANVPGGYSYWKQRYDGGFLVKVTSVEGDLKTEQLVPTARRLSK